MTNIYKQHDAAFGQVSAHAILKDGIHKMNVSFKFPRDGAGRLYCYVHIIGQEMARGFAGGYGYDKRTASFQSAVANMKEVKVSKETQDQPWHVEAVKADNREQLFLKEIANSIGGEYWHDALRNNGFTVINVI